MFIEIKDLEASPLEFNEAFRPDQIALVEHYQQKGDLKTRGRADLIEETREKGVTVQDIRLVGSLQVKVESACARCLETVVSDVDRQFDVLYRPQGVDRHGDESSISLAETEIGYYEGDGILLEDVLREQVLLAVPMRMVCNEACKGLCAYCGRNLNQGACDCAPVVADPRWDALHEIKKKLDR